MKRILTMLLAFALCCTTCYGMEFVDTFSSSQNTDAASYQNLVTRSGDPMDDFNWPAAQDQTFCSLPSASTVGSVLYQIRGAQWLCTAAKAPFLPTAKNWMPIHWAISQLPTHP